MAEYIEREALSEKIRASDDLPHMKLYADTWLYCVEAADVAPVVHGRWELHGNDDDCGCSYFCSNCGANYDEDWFYNHGQFVPFKGCPNCFARMDLEEMKHD